jgi:5-methylthioribose kinase
MAPNPPMLWLDCDNAEHYLREKGRIEPRQRLTIQRLAGGVSNEVLYVAFPDGDGDDFVLKQARLQLRTPDPWFCGLDRIWREMDVMQTCRQILDRKSPDDAGASRSVEIPRILFEDRDIYAFAMSAAPREHVVWKQQLLAGYGDVELARACAVLLARLHAGSWGDAAIAQRLADNQIFWELRLSPYYETLQRAFPTSSEAIGRLIASVVDHPCSLVHADFSPKNLLVYPGGLMMVDFETGHYGDPAFDLGFFLSHLVLKAFYRAPQFEPYLALTEVFWSTYRERMLATISATEYDALVRRGIQNFAGCAWARLDGKSKVEYLLESPWRDTIRSLCREILNEPVESWNGVLSHCRGVLRSHG